MRYLHLVCCSFDFIVCACDFNAFPLIDQKKKKTATSTTTYRTYPRAVQLKSMRACDNVQQNMNMLANGAIERDMMIEVKQNQAKPN